MTAFARHRQLRPTALRLGLALAAALFCAPSPGGAAPSLSPLSLPSLPPLPTLPGLGDRVWQDAAGIALHGFDPVAYFAEGRAVGGRPQHEVQHDGVVWRFANAANRRAFLASPLNYQPAFGGYDAAAMALGRAVEAKPDLFLIDHGRLFLFRTAAGRDQFARTPHLQETALERWPEVERQLAR